MSTVPTESTDALLTELVAERDISRLMVRYAETIDYGDHAAWTETFTEDGVFDVRRRGETWFTHVGHEALRGFVEGHSHAPETYHKHLLGLPSIQVGEDGRTATARTYFTMLHESPGGPIVLVFGRYLDRFTRTDDAGWRFAERIVDMEDVGTR